MKTWVMCGVLMVVAVHRGEAAQRQRVRQKAIEASPAEKQRARQKTKKRDGRIIDTKGRVISPAVIARENELKRILTETMDRELRLAAQSGDQQRWIRTQRYWRKQLRTAGLDGL